MRARWQALQPRERLGIVIAAAAVGLWLVIGVAIVPASRVLKAAPATQAALEQQWQTMQQQAAEAKELRQLPPVTPEVAMAALESAVARLAGDDAQAVELRDQGAQLRLTLRGVDPSRLPGWLTEIRAGARAQIVQAQLTRDAQGRLNGSMTLRLGAEP